MAEPAGWARRGWSRRTFLKVAGAAVGTGLVAAQAPAWSLGGSGGGRFLVAHELDTLNAALARMIPASRPGDWSAADLGVATYIDNILSASFGTGAVSPVFAAGPYRAQFSEFQTLSRVKTIGWREQVSQWQRLYRSGLAGLDTSALGNFATAPVKVQDVILEELDTSGAPFFAVLYDHTMEGTYSHPVYGGNAGYAAWRSVGFAGDVHGVRFPSAAYSQGAWNVYGGYAPEEIVAVGSASTEQPVTGSGA